MYKQSFNIDVQLNWFHNDNGGITINWKKTERKIIPILDVQGKPNKCVTIN